MARIFKLMLSAKDMKDITQTHWIIFIGVEHVSVEQKEEKWDFVAKNVDDADGRRKVQKGGQRDLRSGKGNGEGKSQLSLGNQH